MTAQELKNRLQDTDFVIYGNGFVAEMFYAALEKRGLLARLRKVVSTFGAEERFHGFKVDRYSDTDCAKMVLCLAVHESVKDDIVLNENDEVVFIYPYLYDLLYGERLCEKKMKVSDILAAQDPADNWITARYAAVKGIEENEPGLLDLYLKCQRFHCSEKTAKRRLEYLKGLLKSIKESGFDSSRPVLLDEDLRVIDGLHRIAIARRLGTDLIDARIYKRSGVYDKLLGEKNRLTDGFLTGKGCISEQKLLEGLAEEIFESEHDK